MDNALTYTLTPSASSTDTIALASSADGTFSPVSLSFSDSSAAQTFTYTPATAGTKTLTVTSEDGDSIAGSPVTLTVSAKGYTLSGPMSGYVGNPLAYALTPSGFTTDTITFSDGGAGGTFNPPSITFADSSSVQSFSYTPASVGTKTLTIMSADGGTIAGLPITLSVSRVNYTLTGSTVGFVGYALAYALLPSGMTNDILTFSDSGGGGTFYPSNLAINESGSCQTFCYVPGSNGTKTLTITSTDGGTITGSPLSLSVSTIPQKMTKKWFGGLRSQRPKTRFN